MEIYDLTLFQLICRATINQFCILSFLLEIKAENTENIIPGETANEDKS